MKVPNYYKHSSLPHSGIFCCSTLLVGWSLEECPAEFSAQDAGVHVNAMQLHSLQKQTNLKLKARPKQLLGYLPLAFVLH